MDYECKYVCGGVESSRDCYTHTPTSGYCLTYQRYINMLKGTKKVDPSKLEKIVENVKDSEAKIKR